MKIYELINELSQYNPDAEVYMVDTEQNYCFDIVEITETPDKNFVDLVFNLEIQL